MKHAWLVAIVLCLAVTGAWAQFDLGVGGWLTPRSIGMGTASIGVANDSAAWIQNPAGLASLSVPVPEGKEWGHQVIGVYGNVDLESRSQLDSALVMDGGGDSLDLWGASWSGWQPERGIGVGAGFADVEDNATYLGAGFGAQFGETPVSWGVNILNADWDSDGSDTLLNLGFLYRVPQPDNEPIRLGLTVTDVTDETDMGPYFNVGAYWPATPNFGVAVDVLDISDESDDGPYFNAGVEFAGGAAGEWALRGGVVDSGDGHDFTAGAGYSWGNWRVDVAYADIMDGFWAISGAGNF